MGTDEGAVKEALLHLHGHRGGKKALVNSRDRLSCYKVVSGERSLVFTLAHASLCPRNAEEEKSRVGEGSLCLWRGRCGSDIPPTAHGDSSHCNICSGTGAKACHPRIRQTAKLAKVEVKLAWFGTYIGQKDNNSIRNAGIAKQNMLI